MMNKHLSVFAACLMVASSPAFAGNSLSVGYLVDASIDDNSGTEIDGDGFSFAFNADLSPGIYTFGEYIDRTYEESGIELGLAQTRIGIGLYQSIVGTGDGRFYGGVSFERGKVEILGSSDSDNGIGLRIGVQTSGQSGFSFTGEAAYLSIGDTKGFELLGGVAVAFSPTIAGFADYRITELEDDSNGSNDELSLNDIRVGIRIGF